MSNSYLFKYFDRIGFLKMDPTISKKITDYGAFASTIRSVRDSSLVNFNLIGFFLIKVIIHRWVCHTSNLEFFPLDNLLPF